MKKYSQQLTLEVIPSESLQPGNRGTSAQAMPAGEQQDDDFLDRDLDELETGANGGG